MWQRTLSLRLILGLLAVLAPVAFWGLTFVPKEDFNDYLTFADSMTHLGIPQFMDVTSNLAFLIAGLVPLPAILRSRGRIPEGLWRSLLVLALSVVCVTFGSAAFHLEPSRGLLFWDRLPMCVGFAALLCAMISDRIDDRLGQRILPATVIASVTAILGWHLQLLDLRPYVLVQFGSLLLVLLLATLRPPKYVPNSGVLGGLALYALAKLFELFDYPIFTYTGFISGHTLKHLAAALAVYAVLSKAARAGLGAARAEMKE